MDASLLIRFDKAIEAVTRLQSGKRKLEAQVLDLESEIKTLKEGLRREQAQSSELLDKIKILKLAQNIGGGPGPESDEKRELKRKLNDYIREIDHCIELLSE